MKILVLILRYVCCGMLVVVPVPGTSRANEWERFIKLTCIPELGVAELTGLVVDQEILSSRYPRKEQLDTFKKKYGLITKEGACLFTQKITFRIAEKETRSAEHLAAPCGTAMPSTLEIWEDQLRIKEIPLGGACQDIFPDIVKYGPTRLRYCVNTNQTDGCFEESLRSLKKKAE